MFLENVTHSLAKLKSARKEWAGVTMEHSNKSNKFAKHLKDELKEGLPKRTWKIIKKYTELDQALYNEAKKMWWPERVS